MPNNLESHIQVTSTSFQCPHLSFFFIELTYKLQFSTLTWNQTFEEINSSYMLISCPNLLLQMKENRELKSDKKEITKNLFLFDKPAS